VARNTGAERVAGSDVTTVVPADLRGTAAYSSYLILSEVKYTYKAIVGQTIVPNLAIINMGDTLFFKPRQSVEVTSFQSNAGVNDRLQGLLTAAGSSSQERLARARRCRPEMGPARWRDIGKARPPADGAAAMPGPAASTGTCSRVWPCRSRSGRSRDRR